MHFGQSPKYARLEPQEKTDRALGWQQHCLKWTALTFLLLVVASMSYIAGSWQRHSLLAPLGPMDRTFQYDKHFGKRPDEESDLHWQGIFPKGRGFVRNPSISSDIVGLSVFHQLHCLDALRRSYYAALDGTQDHSNHTKPGHVRHCIDYLRQSLMCHADTNLEPVDPELEGVTGWNSLRRCRDYEALVAWTNEWRTHNQTTIT